MLTRTATPVLADRLLPESGRSLLLRQALLVVIGIAALTIAAKIKVPFWPVPITMQTFVVLTLGAAYGARMGALTILGYLALGAVGLDVFTGTAAGVTGLTYMMGGTGGYLLGYAFAALALGALAQRGWDRRPLSMLGAMLIGEALVFAPGLLWLGHLYADAQGWTWVLKVGLVDFMLAEALKIALAAFAIPALWRLSGSARG